MWWTWCFFLLRRLRPPRATRTDTLFPYTTLFRSQGRVLRPGQARGAGHQPGAAYQAGGEDRVEAGRKAEVDGDVEIGRAADFGCGEMRHAVDHALCGLAGRDRAGPAAVFALGPQSAEKRRVGNECVRSGRYRWSPAHYDKKTK